MLDSPLQWMLDRRVLKNSLEHATFAAPVAVEMLPRRRKYQPIGRTEQSVG